METATIQTTSVSSLVPHPYQEPHYYLYHVHYIYTSPGPAILGSLPNIYESVSYNLGNSYSDNLDYFDLYLVGLLVVVDIVVVDIVHECSDVDKGIAVVVLEWSDLSVDVDKGIAVVVLEWNDLSVDVGKGIAVVVHCMCLVFGKDFVDVEEVLHERLDCCKGIAVVEGMCCRSLGAGKGFVDLAGFGNYDKGCLTS